MAPPQLAADAPVLDVLHPLEIGLGPVLRHETNAAVLHALDRGLGERRDAHIPLIGEPRLEHRVATIATRNLVRVRLDLLDQAQRLEVGDDLLARDETIQAAIFLRAPRR